MLFLPAPALENIRAPTTPTLVARGTPCLTANAVARRSIKDDSLVDRWREKPKQFVNIREVKPQRRGSTIEAVNLLKTIHPHQINEREGFEQFTLICTY